MQHNLTLCTVQCCCNDNARVIYILQQHTIPILNAKIETSKGKYWPTIKYRIWGECMYISIYQSRAELIRLHQTCIQVCHLLNGISGRPSPQPPTPDRQTDRQTVRQHRIQTSCDVVFSDVAFANVSHEMPFRYTEHPIVMPVWYSVICTVTLTMYRAPINHSHTTALTISYKGHG